jgi:hypothetical protein
MIVLLDENFPLRLMRALREAGYDTEHIIELGQRGVSDATIVERLRADPVLFLTQDSDFLDMVGDLAAILVVSHVPQSLPIASRVTIWLTAVQHYFRYRPEGECFELFENGQLIPVTILPN